MIYTQYFIGFPTNEIKRKERKRKKQKKYQRYKCEKGKCNFYLFADDMTVYIENPHPNPLRANRFSQCHSVSLMKMKYLYYTLNQTCTGSESKQRQNADEKHQRRTL